MNSSEAPECAQTEAARLTIRTGKLAVNLEQRLVTVDGNLVRLAPKEYKILELLSLRKGTVLTKEMFLNHLYGGKDEPEIKIIDVFVCNLRKRLAQATGGHDYIVAAMCSEILAFSLPQTPLRSVKLAEKAAGRCAPPRPRKQPEPASPVQLSGVSHSRSTAALCWSRAFFGGRCGRDFGLGLRHHQLRWGAPDLWYFLRDFLQFSRVF